MAPTDRECSPRALANPIRRWFLPPRRELDLLDVREHQVVADLGAGVGYFDAEILRRVGADGRLYAVDPDAENLEIARRRVGADPRVTFLAHSAARVPEIPDASIDRALLSLVLCCLVDKEGTMDETWRMLKPGGLAFVSYPRRGLPRRRTSGLRVSQERWASLLRRRAWEALPLRPGRLVERHLLRKPGRPA
jgi:ubiquinone/menaquinone biosynthesis C-methylase UbiE